MKPERFQLDNGMTVILYEDHTAPVVAMQMWVAVGSADETELEAGLAHLHEHMLFRGTESRGVGEIARQIESVGGTINAWTSYDQTVYYIVTASRFGEIALEILADAIAHSTFDSQELQRELEIIQEEIKEGEDLPSMVLAEALFREAFTRHPYGRPIIGTQESVSSFTREAVLDFYRRWYRPPFMTLVIAGDFQAEPLKGQIDRLFGILGGGSGDRPGREPEPPQTETRVTVQFRDVQESQLSVAFHVPGLAHQDIPALELLTILLGQGESSILFRELKRNQMLATDVYSYLYTPHQPGILIAGASFPGGEEPQDPLEVLGALLREIFKTRHLPVTRADLERAKTMLESETVYEIETVQGRASRMGYFQVVAGDLSFEPRFFETAARVTPQQLLEVARQYLRPENMTVGLLLPERMREGFDPNVIPDLARESFQHALQLEAPPSLVADAHGIVRHRFPNGLTLLVQEDHSVPLVAVRAVLPGGVRFENKDNNGIHNFLADLLTSGTETRSSQEIAHQIESMAGALAGFSGRSSVGMQMVVLSRYFDGAFDLLADCLMHSQFPPEEVERIRRDVLAELEAQQDDLAGSAFRQMLRVLFRGHPLQLDLLGTRASVERFEQSDFSAYYQEHFHPGRLVLAIVGDVTASHVIESAARAFPLTETAEPLRADLPPLVPPVREQVTSTRERQQAHIVLGFQSVGLDHPDRWPLEVLCAILSAQGGRLFNEMRERQSLAYSVGATCQPGLDGGYLAVYVATSPEKIEEAVASLEREIRLLHQEEVSAEELERAQHFLVGQREISLQRAAARAAHLGFDEAYGLGYDDFYRFPERILGVTATDILRVARQYLLLEQGVLSLVRPTFIPEPPETH
ncbi:MAG: insulinase family protein [Bradymonadales bacterium]|nr:insulinase family protein [Bradymonadales bacterium]